MKKVLGVIPARFASTRFPGKPMALIQGKPMIQWVVEATLKAKSLSTVLVATDDEKIARAAKDAGAEAVMTDSDLPSGTDRICAAIKGRDADIVVNIQGDEPLIRAEMLEELIAPMLEAQAPEMSTLACELSEDELQNPNVVKALRDVNGNAIYFSRFPVPYSRGQAKGNFACLKHIGLYAYKRDFLEKFRVTPPSALELGESLEQLRALELGAKIRVVPTRHRSLGVDPPEDLAKIEKMLRGPQ